MSPDGFGGLIWLRIFCKKKGLVRRINPWKYDKFTCSCARVVRGSSFGIEMFCQCRAAGMELFQD